mmetsp:Transcript_26564/g.33178  ORF Transcript_26564/g.33178 Transcript_26564/m.33178 type:complete len:403 (+) Transcript_26564:30-1238(+)
MEKKLPYSDMDVKKASIVVALISFVLLAFLLLMIGFYPSSSAVSPHPVGLVAVGGAIMVFGSCGITFKMPSLANEDVDPVVFQIYNAIGISTVSIPLLLYLVGGNYFRFEPFGLIAAFDIIITSTFAYSAVQKIGMTIAPAIWAGTGIIVSFCWGVAVFGESVVNLVVAVVSIILLAVGVVGIAINKAPQNITEENNHEVVKELDQLESERKIENQKMNAPLSSINSRNNMLEEHAKQQNNNRVQFGGMGIFFCLIAGICDGSLMVPYKLQEMYAPRNDFTNTLNYLASFGIGTVITIPAILFFYYAMVKRQPPALKFSVAAFPGIISGMLWGIANFLSVHATKYLGIAVGFPLTQTCICINALWGILFFKEVEISNRLFLLKFSLALATILSGATMLAQFG